MHRELTVTLEKMMNEERLIAAITQSSSSPPEATAMDVSLATGVSLEEAETSLARLMVDTNGSYEVRGEGDNTRVVYRFPSNVGLRARRRRWFECVREDVGVPIWDLAMGAAKVSFGVVLFVSLALVGLVVVAVAIAALVAHAQSGGGSRRRMPRLRINDLAWMYYLSGPYGYNPFFSPFYAPRIPFWWWWMAARNARRYRGVQRRRREVWAEPYEAEEQPAPVVEDVEGQEPLIATPAPTGVINIVYSFLFGDDIIPDASGWRKVGVVIKRNGCVVPAEFLAPYLPEPPTHDNFDHAAAKAAVHFKGRPVPTDGPGFVFEFPRLRDLDDDDDDVRSYQEQPQAFGVTQDQALGCVCAGLVNLFGVSVIYLALDEGSTFQGILPPTFRVVRRVAERLFLFLVCYAVLFLLVPSLRFLYLRFVVNRRLHSRNAARLAFRTYVDNQLLEPDTKLAYKARFAKRHAENLKDNARGSGAVAPAVSV